MLPRRIHSIVLLIALLLGCAGMNYVQAATYSGSCGANATWSYNTINYKLTISGSGAMTNYTSSSPAPWDSYKTSILTISISNTITSIGDYAFASCTKVPSVSMGTGLKSIGSNAFKGCSSLSRAMIPNGVTTIGEAAFYNCTNLVYVSIPEGVTSLGSQAFYGCTKLTWISIPNSVTKLGTYTLSGSGIVDIYVYWTTTSGDHCIPVWTTGFVTKVPQTAVTLHVPCGTRSMYMGLTGWRDFTVVEPQYTITAQTNNSSYGTVKIDDGTIGAEVSKTVNCATSVTLTAVTTTSNCNIDFLQWNDGVKDNPRTVTVTAAATYTAQFGTLSGNCGASGNNLTWSFNRCTGVLTISGSGAMADWGAEADVPWYDYRESITSVVLPYGMTHIGDYAFRKTRITKIDLPSALQTIGKYAFSATLLLEVCIPEGVTSIGEKAFISGSEYYYLSDAYAAPLRRVYLPSTLTELGNASIALAHLQYLTYPKSITTLGHTYYYQSKYPAKELYASWTTNIPSRYGPIASVTEPKQKMHIPYGTTAAYRAKDWARVHDLVEDVDERAIDLGLSIRWASCNIGATSPEENGEYYMWADTLGGWSSYVMANYPYYKNGYSTRYNETDHRTRLIPFDDAAYIRWGETWRMPTKDEWNELFTQCKWEKEKLNDVWVYKVTGPNGNYIYIPLAGYKSGSPLYLYNENGYYWTSELSSIGAPFIASIGGMRNINSGDPSYGRSVRAVYRREWPSFTLTITDTPEGSSYTKAVNAGSSYTLTAQEDDCHHFVQWSDGNTSNPRTVNVTADATYTAEYEYVPLASGTCGAEGNENNITWSLSCDGVLTISGTGEMANYTSSNNAPWYSYRESITSVVIEDGVTTIGRYAFYNCTNLTSVTVPPSITLSGQGAFSNCYAIESLYIADLAAWCNIYFDGNESYPFINDNLWGTPPPEERNLYVHGTKVTTLTIPDGVTAISNYAFCGFTGITDIQFNQVTTIGQHAFANCDGLTDVTIPEGVINIYFSAFHDCTQLRSMSIPATLSSTSGWSMMYNCPALTDFYVHWTENIPSWMGYTNKDPQSSITLHVPCSAIDLYRAKTYWKDYTIEGEGTFTVTVTTNDASMGDVSIIVN